jgi:copper transport protein
MALTTAKAIARWCSALALAGLGFALAASGHAATAGPEFVTRPAIFLHAVCVAFWLGALLPLTAELSSGVGRANLLRFSKAVPGPFLVLVASGLLLAIVQVQRIEALWTTNYGIILSCKLLAVCLLLGLAAFNRWLTPRVAAEDARATRRFQRSVLAEFTIMIVILGLVASWRFTPPPRAILMTATQPVHAHIHTNRAMVDLRIETTTQERRRIIVTLLDGQFAPLAAKEVSIALSKPDAGIEPLRISARHNEATTWQVDDVRLPVLGRWRIAVDILVNDFEKITLADEIDVSK